jgi:hypothetical protein
VEAADALEDKKVLMRLVADAFVWVYRPEMMMGSFIRSVARSVLMIA